MPITVVIADDREFLRKAIRSLLDLDGDIKIVGEAENFPQTIALMRELNPHVVVMDLHMDAPDDFSPNASYSCDQPMSRTVPRIPRPPPVPPFGIAVRGLPPPNNSTRITISSSAEILFSV